MKKSLLSFFFIVVLISMVIPQGDTTMTDPMKSLTLDSVLELIQTLIIIAISFVGGGARRFLSLLAEIIPSLRKYAIVQEKSAIVRINSARLKKLDQLKQKNDVEVIVKS